MYCFYSCHSETGPVREGNQDAVLLRCQELPSGENLILAVVCDGVGGFQKGELASAHAVRSLSHWFDAWLLPRCRDRGHDPLLLGLAWEEMLQRIDFEIREYGRKQELRLGTTLTAFLLIGSEFLISQVGDSRCYQLRDSVELMTHDQVQEGSHALTQCVGGRRFLKPVFQTGVLGPEASTWFLCCDGFWHYIREEELLEAFRPEACRDSEYLSRKLQEICNSLMMRGETDNISAAVVCLLPDAGKDVT